VADRSYFPLHTTPYTSQADLDVVTEELDKAEKKADALDKTQRARMADRDDAVRRKGAKEVELTKLNSEATVRQSVERQRDEVSFELVGGGG
jgi:hypothetical protein